MSDAEIVRACAEQVMGWPAPPKSHGSPIRFRVDEFTQYTVWANGGVFKDAHQGEWNPLTSDADNCMLLDPTKGFSVLKWSGSDWVAEFINGVIYGARDTDRRRAICVAALESVGVKA